MGKFIQSLLEQQASQAASTAQGGLFGSIFGGINDKRQRRQAEHLQNLQMRGNLALMEAQKKNDLDMWKATSFVGQMEQIKNAGLSPGLIYGMGGPTGTTGGNAPTVSGQHAPSGGGEMAALSGQAATFALTNAQRKLIEAQTANVEEQTKNLPKTGENIESQTALNKLNHEILQFEKEIKGRSVEATIRAIDAAAEKLMHQAVILRNQENISEATWQTDVSLKMAELVTVALQNNLTTQLTKESEQKVKNMVQEIINKSRELDQKDLDIAIRTFEANLKQEMPGISQSVGRLLNGAINEYLHWTKGILGNKGAQEPIKK